MILVDFNQVMIATLFSHLGNHTNAPVEEDMLRHMVLNTLKSHKKKFHREYGDLIICTDSKHSWRRGVFPYYKAARRKSRETSEMNWHDIFESFTKIKNEIDEYMPYKVIEVNNAEADDIIGSIVIHEKEDSVICGVDTSSPILIISSDKDFIQLHRYPGVKQYSPISRGKKSRWIQSDDPELYLKEQVFRGDTSDGVPNVYSDDNCLVIGERQKMLTKKRLQSLMDGDITPELQRNIDRNKMLIDLRETPEELKQEIINIYMEKNTKNRSKVLKYLQEYRLRNLIQHLNDF